MRRWLRSMTRRARTRAFWLDATFVVAVTITAAALAFLVTTRQIVKSADAVVLDDLTGRDAAEAAVWLAARGLRAEIDHFESNDQAEPLTVVFHEPTAGDELRPGNVVRLVISRGARSIPVPDIRGIDAAQGRLILERNGLFLAEPLEIHHPSAAGTVVGLAPSASSPVPVGTFVRPLLSKGPAPRAWITPSVQWLLHDGVQELTAAMGVPLEIGQRLHHPDEADGAILEQFPGPGSLLVEGQPLRVTVNGDAGVPPVKGGAELVTLSLVVPRGFSARSLVIQVARGGWMRTLFEEVVRPGERVRVVAAVMPGDRAVATLDGVDLFTRRF